MRIIGTPTRSAALLACLSLALVAATPGDASAQQRARQGLLSLEDARIFYEVVGTGDPIVVVHGGPGLDHAYLQPGLDALKAGLELTPSQAGLWAPFAEAIAAMRGPHGPGMGMTGPGSSLPDRLARHETMMSSRLEAVRRARAALAPLYAALDPAQKARLDAGLCPHRAS